MQNSGLTGRSCAGTQQAGDHHDLHPHHEKAAKEHTQSAGHHGAEVRK